MAATIAGHEVRLDGDKKIIPWFQPTSNAHDEFLQQRWNFIKTGVPLLPSGYPQYYFCNGFSSTAPSISPDKAMNDVGEKIPNWFESARLYYAYSGDTNVMDIVRRLIDYTIAHGTSPSNFAWPNFPHTTTRADDTKFEGFTPTFAKHEVQVDLGGEMGLTYFRLWQFTGEAKYLTNALHVADALAAHARKGTATHSVWPYRVKLDDGRITAEYGANWIGCYALLDSLITAGCGNTNAYARARALAREFILQFPMKTGYWTDGHSDNPVNGHTYKSNTTKSNTALYLFDHPEFDPDWRTHIPMLIAWTETNFVYRVTAPEPAEAYGAQIVGEQDSFNYKMDYQTARHAAECARWFAASGDASYREKAYRCLNWVTYCSDANGRATESPYSLNIATWWSDCYGEGPRMFYHAFAAVPEWAPPGEDHILYSEGILTDVSYRPGEVRYTARDATGTEYLRLSFKPTAVTLNNSPLAWKERPLGDGDYAVTILHNQPGQVRITGTARPLRPKPARVIASFVGYRNEGTQTDTIWNNGAWINACRFPGDDLTVSNIFAKVTAIPGRYQCAIYTDQHRLLRASSAVKNPGDGWQTFTLTAPVALAKGQHYWLAIWSDDPNARVYAQSGGTIRWGRYDFGAWPDPLNLTDGGDMTYCIYAGNRRASGNATVTIDGAKTHQVIDGFGVNANHRSWRGDELKPVLDALIDQAGMTLFRVVIDNTDWSSPTDSRLTPLWDMFAYLNARGLTNTVFLNFMGPGPQSLGGGTLTIGKEDDWAKMIAELLAHARNKQHLQFRLIAPNNEPDIANEGIRMGAAQYTTCLRKLAEQLDAYGLRDVRLIAPDLAGNDAAYRKALAEDPAIMAKLAHWGVHSYSSTAGIIKDPARTCWVTEFNVWCNTCDSGVRGTYDWNYCRGTAEYLLSHLANGASAGFVWEGYDSFYLHPPSTWSYWGLFAVDNEKAPVKTYTLRKNFYTVAQISRFVRPGARRVDVAGAPLPLLAFRDTGVTVVGINKTDRAITLEGSLASLPLVRSFDLYYTTATTNLARGASVPVTDRAFSVTVPSDCIFTLVGRK